MNMLVQYEQAGRFQFRQVFAEGVTAAEAAFRDWLGPCTYEVPIIAIYRAASIHDGKPNQSSVAIQWWSNGVPGWDFTRSYENCSVAQALSTPPFGDARPYGAWVAV